MSGQCPVGRPVWRKKLKVTRESLDRIGIKAIECAWKNREKDARHTIADKRCPGLMLITNAGSQTWAVEYKPRGRDPVTCKRFPMKTVTIGTPGTHSPDEALAEALRIKGLTKTGKDPAAVRKAEIAEAARQRSATVERAAAEYVAVLPGKEKKGGGRISESWAREQADHLYRAVAALGIASASIESVDVATVRKLQHGQAYRHRFGAFNRFLDWCVHEDRIAANPCASIGRAYRPAAGGERERMPSLRELATIWAASEKALEPVFRDFVQFAITTPARRNEIANLRWEHLDLGARIWEQPGRLTKNRDAHSLWLHAGAFEILVRRYEAAGRPKTGLVFPSPRSATPITAFSGILRALHRATWGLAKWSLHDLRRSFATTLGRIGEDDEATIDQVLNHRESATKAGVIGVYNRARKFPAQKAALERWGATLKAALEGREEEAGGEVVPSATREQQLEKGGDRRHV